MANPEVAPRPVVAVPPRAAAAAPPPRPLPTPMLLTAMLQTSSNISDFFLLPAKPPMVEINGQLAATGRRALSADDTRRIAGDLIGDNKHALASLRELG